MTLLENDIAGGDSTGWDCRKTKIKGKRVSILFLSAIAFVSRSPNPTSTSPTKLAFAIPIFWPDGLTPPNPNHLRIYSDFQNNFDRLTALSVAS
jgi:hypothetical protein